MDTRRANFSGTAHVLGLHSSNLIKTKLTAKFRANGWKVAAIAVTYAASNTNKVILSCSFDVYINFSSEEIKSSFQNIINNFTENDLLNNGDFSPVLTNWDFDVKINLPSTSSSIPKTNSSSNNSSNNLPAVTNDNKSNSNPNDNNSDWIGKLANDLGFSRQTIIIILALGGVLLLKKLIDG